MKNKLNSAALALLLLFTAAPLCVSFFYALLYSIGLAGILHSGFTLSYWTATFSSHEVLSSFLFSFYVAVASMTITIAGALFIAAIFRTEFMHQHWLTMIYLPLGIPAIVAAFFSFEMLSKAGFLSRIAYHLHLFTGIRDFPDLVNDRFGIGVIATHILMALPFFIILFTNLTESENLDDMRRLSRTLGASFLQAELRISIPILLRRAFPTIVLYFIFVLGSYEIPLLLGIQFPPMISVLIVRKLQKFNLQDIPTAYTMAVLYLTFVALFIAVLFRKRKLTYDF